MKRIFLANLYFFLICYSPAFSQENSAVCGGADLSAKSFSYGLSGSLEEEFVNVDPDEQRRRVLECSSGTSKCFEQFSGANQNGQYLLSFDLNGDTGREKPEVLKINIKSTDFTNAKLISCLNQYWKNITFPSPKMGQIFGSGKIVIHVKKTTLLKEKQIPSHVDSCEKMKDSNAVITKLNGQHKVKYEKYDFIIGGDEEEYVGQIDRKAERDRIAGCMKGTVACLKRLPPGKSQGKMILSFLLTNQKNTLPPAIAQFKFVSNDFISKEFSNCMQTYWMGVYHVSPIGEGISAEVKIPITVDIGSK